MYSNKTERANQDIYDDLKLKLYLPEGQSLRLHPPHIFRSQNTPIIEKYCRVINF